MKHLTKRRELILAILWTLVIFTFSLQSGDDSIITSNIVLDILAWMFPILKDPAHLELVILVIRKTAHFTEYFILGYFYTKAYKATGVERILMIGWFIPIIDESIQLFSPGRSASPVDMAVDLSGYLTGLLVFGTFMILVKRFRKNWIGK